MEKDGIDSGKYLDLRQRAEAFLQQEPREVGEIPAEEIQHLVHELQVHQIELEMQNDELRRAQEALEASRARDSARYDLAPMGYVTVSEEGLILEANLTAATLLGAARGALVKQPLSRFILPEDKDIYCRHRKQLFETGEPQRCELRMLRQGGSPFWVRLEAIVARDKESEAPACRVVMSDITERTRAEETLRKSEAQLRAILDATPFPIALVDIQDNNIEFWSRSALTLFGHTAPTAPEWYQIAYPDPDYRSDVVDRWKPFLEKAQQSGQAVNTGEYRVTCRDGSVRICELYAAFLADRLVVTFNDVTERKQAEEALQQSAQRLRNMHKIDQAILAAQSPESLAQAVLDQIRQLVPCQRASIVVFDPDLHVGTVLAVQVNGTTTVGKGAPVPIEAFETIADIRHGKIGLVEDIQALAQPSAVLQALGSEGMRSVINVPLVAREALIGTLNLAADQPGAFGPDLVDIIREVAGTLAVAVQQTRLQKEIARYTVELEQRVAERTAQLQTANKELESFSYSVSHDLRAPLRAIGGFAGIIARRHRAELNEQAQHYFDNIVLASERMGQLIDDLLAYSRLGRQAIGRSFVNLDDVLAQAAGDLAGRAAELQATITIAPGLPGIYGNATLLQQIFVNLLDNALAYHRLGTPPQITVTGSAEGGRVTLRVADHGIGIPPEYHEKIFDVFQRLHSEDQYPGTGIGLAVVKKAVEMQGGRVWVESAVGEGSTFFVQLPEET
jgi:PAS domain S-box-containing protein